MKVRIKENAYSRDSKLNTFLKERDGEYINVETNNLFNNQYNTKEFRIFDAHISEVVNDSRINKGTCKYCGTLLDKNKQQNECNKHTECKQYGIEWFTDKNTYFIKNPKGLQTHADFEPQKIGTYTLEYGYNNDYLVLRNMRKNIKFRVFDGEIWEFNGIGYTNKVKGLSIPIEVENKLYKILRGNKTKK